MNYELKIISMTVFKIRGKGIFLFKNHQFPKDRYITTFFTLNLILVKILTHFSQQNKK